MILSFGDFELDEERFELRQGGRKLPLQPKVLSLLLYLARNRERVVSKDELLEALWPGTAVTYASLARAVSLARAALDVGAGGRKAIETSARRGYRFALPASERPPRAASGPGVAYAGRKALLARLETSLDLALCGAGRVIVLAGEAGVGKTRTAEILVARAEARAASIGAAWGIETGSPTHRAWARSLQALTSQFPAATRPIVETHVNDLASLLADPPNAESELHARGAASPARRERRHQAVAAVLAACAAQQPIVLVLDDLHAADAESLAMLASVAPAITRLPIAILATCRDAEIAASPAHARAFEQLLRVANVERWPVPRLHEGEVREFIELRVRGVDPECVAVLARKTGGNPLLLGESLRSLEARGLLAERRDAAVWGELLPSGIRHLLEAKLLQLPAPARDALRCAATINLRAPRELLRRCVAEPGALDESLAALAAAGLLTLSPSGGEVGFAHELVRDAVAAELCCEDEPRRLLHARILRECAAGGAVLREIEVRAWHACEGVPHVAPEAAATLASEAARRAEGLHEFASAAAWYQRGLSALAAAAVRDDSAEIALRLALGAAATRAAGVEVGRSHFRLALDAARRCSRWDDFARAALGFAHRPAAVGHTDTTVIEALETALQELPAAESLLRIRLEARLAAELRYADPARAEQLIERAVAAARAAGDASVLAQALDDCSFVRWSVGDPNAWLALNAEIARAARACGDLELALLGEKGRVTGALELGDVALLDRELRALRHTAGELRTPHARWLDASLQAMRALLDGSLDLANGLVAESIRLGERVDSEEIAVELGAQLLYLRREQGRMGELEPAVRLQVQRFPDAPAWRAALALLLSETNRMGEAGSELERLGHHGFADVPRDRGFLPTLALAAEVAHATHATNSARLLAALLSPYAELGVVVGSGILYYGSVAHHLGLLAAASGEWDAAFERFGRAHAVETQVGATLWEARSNLALADALARRDLRGDRERAARLAADTFEAATARSWPALRAKSRRFE